MLKKNMQRYPKFRTSDNPAYFGGGISRVYHRPGYEGQDSIFPRIVKVNPDYWNRELPRSAIQIINFNSIQRKDYLRKIKRNIFRITALAIM